MSYRATVLLLLAATAIPVFAQQPNAKQELEMLRSHCQADIQRLCPGVKPGGGAIKQCLMQQKDQVSVGCAKALQQIKEMHKG